MQQLRSYATPTNESARASWLTLLSSRLPYLFFLIWMVYKQRIALSATGLWPGPAMLAATAGALLLLAPWLFIRPGRSQAVGAVVLNTLLTVLVYADILYFRQFGDLTSVATMRFATQLGSVAGSVTSLIQTGDIWLFADIPVMALLTLAPANWARAALGRLWEPLRSAHLRPRLASFMAVLGAGIVAAVALLDPLMSAKYFGHSNVASRMGLLNYHMVDTVSYASRMAMRATPSSGAVSEVKEWFGAHRNPPGAAPSPLHGAAKGKNVIVIQVESLQAFPLGMKAGGKEVTPNLNRLAQESMNFSDFYHQTGQGVTSDADLLANCSLYPTRTGAVYYDYAANDFRCMPSLLREHGYKAVAMQGMPPDFWNLATVYPRVGFEKYYNLKDDFKADEQIGIGLSDESFFRQSVEKLKALPEPYYAFLVTLTSHGPFDFEGLPKALDLGALEGTQAGHYLHAVHYTDRAIGQFLGQLKAEGLLDKSVLVLYGDHAGVFRSSTGVLNMLGLSGDDEVDLTRMEKRVPFLIRLPGGAAAGERTQPAGEADIAPTLAALLGVPTDSAWFMGRDLLSRKDGAIAFYTGSALDEQHLFWNRDDGSRCYDRKSHESVDTGACNALAQQSARSLEISRLIVQRNLIPKLVESHR